MRGRKKGGGKFKNTRRLVGECHNAEKQKVTTPAGLEPTRDKPNRFLVDRLNRSATVSFCRLRSH
jgi:hypothetical protein